MGPYDIPMVESPEERRQRLWTALLATGLGTMGARRVHEGDLKGLNALLAEHAVKHPLLISLEREPRRLGTWIRALPWQAFVRDLWSGALDV